MPVPGLPSHSQPPRNLSRNQKIPATLGRLRLRLRLRKRESDLRSTSTYILLGFFAALEIPQPNLDCFACNFCPARLRIFGENCGCFRILNLQAQNLNDPIIDLHVCHWYSPYWGDSKTSHHRPSVSLTGLGVHVSMNSCEFSILRRWHRELVYRRFTVLIITKEACT